MIDWPIIFGIFGLGSTIVVQLAAWQAHTRRQASFETKVEFQMNQQSKDIGEMKGSVQTLTSAVSGLTTAVSVSTSQLHDIERRVAKVEGQ